MSDMLEEPVSVPAQQGMGAALRQARESQGMSVADAARAVRLSEKQITALETEDYANLPGRTFVRGFVKNYARLLQLDPESLMSLLPFVQESAPQQIQAPSQKISFSEHHGLPWVKWLMAGFVFLALISWGVLKWLGPVPSKSGVTDKPPVPATVAQAKPPAPVASDAQVKAQLVPPASSPTQTSNPVATSQAKLIFTFTGRSWVEVRDKQGKIVYSQISEAGAAPVVEGELPLSVVIGSAPNVKLSFNGREVDISEFTKADVARLVLQ